MSSPSPGTHDLLRVFDDSLIQGKFSMSVGLLDFFFLQDILRVDVRRINPSGGSQNSEY